MSPDEVPRPHQKGDLAPNRIQEHPPTQQNLENYASEAWFPSVFIAVACFSRFLFFIHGRAYLLNAGLSIAQRPLQITTGSRAGPLQIIAGSRPGPLQITNGSRSGPIQITTGSRAGPLHCDYRSGLVAWGAIENASKKDSKVGQGKNISMSRGRIPTR